MMSWPPRIDLRVIGAVGLAAALVFAILYIIGQAILLKQMELPYRNPAVHVRIKKVAGPVRIRTVIVERAGEKVTTIEESRAPVVETNFTDSAPVPVSTIMRPHRSDRWLAGASADVFRGRPSLASTTWWAGYSVRNRLDVMGGYRYDDRAAYLYIGGRF